MCVILLCPPKVRPDLATLEACAAANPHGGGIAWREDGTVHFRKIDSPAELHRLARRASLTDHGHAKAVLFQNGTWAGWREAVAKAVRDGHRPLVGPMSDARAAAWLAHLYGATYLGALKPSRWVHFGAAETLIHGEWRTRGGIRFSNLHWCGRDTGLPPHLQAGSNPASNAGNAASQKPKPDRKVVDLWGEHRDYWSRLLPKPACAPGSD